MDYKQIFWSIPNSQWGIASWPNQNMSSMFQSPIESKIKELSQQPVKPKTYTKQDLFWKVDKAVQQWYTPEEAMTELLKSAKQKGYTIEWVDIDAELWIKPVEQPKEKWMFGKLADVWQSIKPTTATDTSWMDTSTLLWSMKKSFFETVVDPLKSLANVPWDAIQIVGQLWDAITHPIETAKSINDIGQGISDNIVYGILNKVTWSDIAPTDNAVIVQGITDALGNLAKDPERMKQLLVENPVDVALTVQGWLQAVRSKITNPALWKAVDNMIEATNPINMLKAEWAIAWKAIGKVAKAPLTWLKEGFKQSYWFDADTISQVLKNNTKFKELQNLPIEEVGRNVADDVVRSIETRIDDLSEVGKGYESVKKWAVITNADEVQRWYLDIVNKVENKQLTKADKTVLKDAVDYIKGYEWDLTDSDVLALRKQLDSVLYDPNTWLKRKLSPQWERIIQWARANIDNIAKDRITGLKELDAVYAPERQLLTKVKGYIYNRDGSLKDNYIQTISNITGKGKEIKLEMLEKINPELSSQVKMYKALEDINRVKEWFKVGTYRTTLPWIAGAGVWFATGWPVWAVVWPLLSFMIFNPTTWIKILNTIAKIDKTITGIVTKVKNGIKLTTEELKRLLQTLDNNLWNLWEDLKEKVWEPLTNIIKEWK